MLLTIVNNDDADQKMDADDGLLIMHDREYYDAKRYMIQRQEGKSAGPLGSSSATLDICGRRKY